MLAHRPFGAAGEIFWCLGAKLSLLPSSPPLLALTGLLVAWAVGLYDQGGPTGAPAMNRVLKASKTLAKLGLFFQAVTDVTQQVRSASYMKFPMIRKIASHLCDGTGTPKPAVTV